MAEITSQIANEQGSMSNNLPGRAMRVSMENKSLLNGKGKLYAGTGKNNVVKVTSVDGGSETYTIPITAAVDSPVSEGSILMYLGEEAGNETGIKWVPQTSMGGGTTVVANPTLSGDEEELTGLEVAGTKYKVPSGSSIDYATTEDIDGLFAPADELLGTWVINEDIPVPFKNITYNVTFTSNNKQYNSISLNFISPLQANVKYDNYVVWSFDGAGSAWMYEAYRTITITDTSALTNREEFTTWLTSNATKQGA